MFLLNRYSYRFWEQKQNFYFAWLTSDKAVPHELGSQCTSFWPRSSSVMSRAEVSAYVISQYPTKLKMGHVRLDSVMREKVGQCFIEL